MQRLLSFCFLHQSPKDSCPCFTIKLLLFLIGTSTIMICGFSITMVNCSPLQNSKRCFKASTQNCKIEALKLAATVNKNSKHYIQNGHGR
ncbi:hypothetical protein FS559_10455 [Treponema phagedenis]|nr:hypothetical protein FS559_10455 [Treponema phagedenis]